jgi:transcriptional regulator with XRE-family HTH domain
MGTRKKSKAAKFLEGLTGGPLTMGKILISIRVGEEMTQAEFAKILGISRSNLCDIEKGRRFISAEMAAKFAESLGDSKKQFIRIALQDQLNRVGLKYHVNIDAA